MRLEIIQNLIGNVSEDKRLYNENEFDFGAILDYFSFNNTSGKIENRPYENYSEFEEFWYAEFKKYLEAFWLLQKPYKNPFGEL